MLLLTLKIYIYATVWATKNPNLCIIFEIKIREKERNSGCMFGIHVWIGMCKMYNHMFVKHSRIEYIFVVGLYFYEKK